MMCSIGSTQPLWLRWRQSQCYAFGMDDRGDDAEPSALVVAEQAPGEEHRNVAQPLPHEGRIHLDRDALSRHWQLSHSVSCEVVWLQAPFDDGLELVYDEGGFACVVGDTFEVTLVDDLLDHSVFTNSDGGFLLRTREAGGDGFEVSELAVAQGRFDLATLQLSVGPTRAQQQVHLAVFERPRSGSSCWWSLVSAYHLIGMQLNVKYASVWLHKHFKRWDALLGDWGLCSHLLRSKQYGEDIDDEARVLPWVSASSSAFFALLAAWSFAPKRRSGLSSADNRAACGVVLQSLVSVMSHSDWQLCFYLVGQVERRWPRPRSGSSVVVLPIDTKGVVDLAPLQEAGGAGVGESATVARFLLKHFEGDGNRLHLLELVGKSMDFDPTSTGWHFAMQLLWEVGNRLDSAIVEGHKGVQLPGARIMQGAEDLSSDYQLDHFLVRYVDTTASVMHGGLWHSCTVDKSRVGTLGLLNGAIVNERNEAAWMVPQAAFVSKCVPRGQAPTEFAVCFPRQRDRGLVEGMGISPRPFRS